jgi:hypothetical protein
MLPSTMVLQTTPPSEHCWWLTPRNAPDALPTLARCASGARRHCWCGVRAGNPISILRQTTVVLPSAVRHGQGSANALHTSVARRRSPVALWPSYGLDMVRCRKTFLGCARDSLPRQRKLTLAKNTYTAQPCDSQRCVLLLAVGGYDDALVNTRARRAYQTVSR